MTRLVVALAGVMAAFASVGRPTGQDFDPAAVRAAQRKIDREFKDSRLSPFTAVAYQYFETGQAWRVALAGRGVTFSPLSTLQGVADLAFDGRAFWITPVNGGKELTLHGKSATGDVDTAIRTPLVARTKLGSGDIVSLGPLLLETFARADAGGAIVHDPDSASSKAFSGLKWFAPDVTYRVSATFARFDNPDKVTVATSRGLQKEYFRLGTFTFIVEGKPQKLVALASSPTPKPGDELFIAFRDATTGHESYEVGRYLNLKFEAPERPYVLDFNLATNPYCAYSPHFNCVIPPRENTLTVAIRAGEMRYPRSH